MSLTLRQRMTAHCTTCGISTKKRCGKCGRAWYCSIDCQKEDWKEHKRNCNPFNIRETHEKGMGLFASCDLEIGDLIIREDPILYMEGGCSMIMKNHDKFKEAFEGLEREAKDRVLALTGADSNRTMWN